MRARSGSPHSAPISFRTKKLYRRIQSATPQNAHQAKLRKDLVEGFEDTGVTLPAEKRLRAREIIDRLEDLRQAFGRNVRDDSSVVIVTPGEMQGLPERYIAAQEKDEHGNFVLGLEFPAYGPFMANAASEDARRRYWIMKTRQGGEANLPLFDEIQALRFEFARLYGLPSYGAYAIRRKMAETPENVMKFLAQVKAAVTELEKKEIGEMRALKAHDLGTALDKTRIEHWDVDYYQEKIRKARSRIDQEALRKYFPTGKSIEYTLLVATTLYGVKFREVKVPVWHPDVNYYDVLDARTGRHLGGFYLDVYLREGKFTHSAAFPIFGGSRLARRTPLAALVVHLGREGLVQDELESLMHEFGHVMHHVLSQTDYAPHSGGNVMGDFVEAPSQMFQEWARREQPLALFGKVCPECPQLGADEIRRLDDARKFGMGIFYAQQWLNASYDMALTSDQPEPALALWQRMEGGTPLGYVEGTLFPASFVHLAGSYGAGYYGYMWSQVLALDMLSAFGNNLLDPKVGKRYRDTILAQGGQRHPAQLVKDFLGREPNSEAFFAEITGTR